MMNKFAILSLLLLSTLSLNAQYTLRSKKPKIPKVGLIYSEIIEISSIQYAKLMSEPMSSSNHTMLRNKLLKQVKAGEAKLISNHTIITRTGERATSKSIKELIYATEYEPAEIYPTTNEEIKTKGGQIVLPPNVTTFESRNLGTTLEVEPIFSEDEQIVDLTVRPETVKLTGYNVLSSWDTQLAKVNVQMPNIYTMQLNTSITTRDNQFNLVGTYSPETNGETDESRKLLHFVRASILNVEK